MTTKKTMTMNHPSQLHSMKRACLLIALVIITIFPTSLFADDETYVFFFKDYPAQDHTRLVDFSGFPPLHQPPQPTRSKRP